VREVEQCRAADTVRRARLGAAALAAWHAGTAAARAERAAAARHKAAWGKVRGWLAELQRDRESAG
jgi:hypothetical protein